MKNSLKILQEKWFFFFIILLIFWKFWLPGERVATDFHLNTQKVDLIQSLIPFSWREVDVADGMGEYTAPILWSQFVHLPFTLLSAIGISNSIHTKLYGLLVLLTAFFGMSKLLKFYQVNYWGQIIGSSVFILNSFFLLLFDGGQLSLALTYALMPSGVLFFVEALQNKNLPSRFKFISTVLLVSIFDLRMIFIYSIIFLFILLLKIWKDYKNFWKIILDVIILGSWSLLFLIILHLYWILPSILSKAPELPPTYDRTSQVSFLSFAAFGHGLYLLQPHWYKNIFGDITFIKWEFIIFPLLAFSAGFLGLFTKASKEIKRIIGIWLTVALAAIFLGKGSNPPFGEVYNWMFLNIPGFSLFRDPVKFYFLIGLSYSVLIAFSVGFITDFKFKNSKLNYLVKVLPILIFIYLVVIVSPVFSGKMNGMLSVPSYENEYQTLRESIENDPSFSRVLYIPTQAPLGYYSPLHPSLEASRLVQKRPFAIGTEGSYETLNFLREASFMGELFDISGIGYVAYNKLDPKKENLKPEHLEYYDIFLNQLKNLSWIKEQDSNSQISLLKTRKSQEKFFLAPNIWWVVGSDLPVYLESTKSASLSLSKNALVFTEEFPGLMNQISKIPEAKIILNEKNNSDLAASFIEDKKYIFPSSKLDFVPGKNGWWKREASDLISWREFLQTKYQIDNLDFDYGGGWAIAEGKLELNIEDKKIKKGNILLARVLESTRSGELKFYQDKQLVGSIQTKKEGDNINWVEVGNITQDNNLTIKSEGEINVLNALASLYKSEWEEYKKQGESLKLKVTKFDEANIKETTANVEFEQINPTKYKIKVSGLQNPEILVFSENYDSNWKLNQKAPVPLYSLVNGYFIEKDGEYLLEYQPQKYVYLGLTITAAAGAFIAIYFLSYFIKRKI